MGKYSDFVRSYSQSHPYETIKGAYGCQTCYLEVSESLFDKDKGLIFWICSQGHRSEIKVGV